MLDFLFGEKVVKTTTTKEKIIQTPINMYNEEDMVNFGWLCREKPLTNVGLLLEQFKKKTK